MRIRKILAVGWLLLLAARDVALTAQSTFVAAYLMTGGGPYYATLFLPLLIHEEAFEHLRFGTASAMIADGTTEFKVEFGGQTVTIPVKVERAAEPRPNSRRASHCPATDTEGGCGDSASGALTGFRVFRGPCSVTAVSTDLPPRNTCASSSDDISHPCFA